MERVGNAANLGFRAAMWEPLTASWLAHPFAGFGPGSFPWVLQPTGYFDTNSYAPRHPDSAIFQLLPEAGALGLLVVGIVLWAVVPRVVRGKSTAARWSVMAFAVACLAANPSDFGFLVMIVIGWFALAVPHERQPEPVAVIGKPGGVIRWATAVSLLVVGVAFAATTVGGLFYAQARDDIAAGKSDGARANLDIAVALDPGLALYRRQRGALSVMTADPAGALDNLAVTTRLNPSDDLGWRSLALAEMSTGKHAEAGASLREAVATHRSVQRISCFSLPGPRGVMRGAAKELLAESVQAWPTIVGAPGWGGMLPSGISTEDVVDRALARWVADNHRLSHGIYRASSFVALANRMDLLPRAIAVSGLSTDLGQATFDAARCTNLDEDLRTLPAGDKRTLQYWQLRVRLSSLKGQTNEAADITRAWGADPRGGDGVTGTMNPLNRGLALGFSADAWGYRREPIVWTPSGAQLPSVSAGADGGFWILVVGLATRV